MQLEAAKHIVEKLVSIPQAVSTIAIGRDDFAFDITVSFNTASGKHYCNGVYLSECPDVFPASFNTASGKHYCNNVYDPLKERVWVFQYRKR